MSDYERLADRLAHAEQTVETVACDTPDSDMLDLLDEALKKLAATKKLAQERA